ncbi:uncharacterized protein LOC111865478 isoform X2 [Cryptotermes secundus]|uniref:uncharacterized protein LOC111865478 isoform X2 n=1 Tax=Cryptotermes secundus TaxID=105785 RepID=UPI001454BFB6|nr:uncharacterized protein LOC111865478 isoform X2 [Cryptotermes secundus]
MQVAVRGEKLYVTKDKRRSQSWRRCICWGIGFVLLSVAILIAVLAGTGVILSQEGQTLVTEKTETSRQLGSSGSDSPRTGGSSDRAGGRSELPPLEASSFTPPPPLQPNIPSMPTTDMSQLYVPRVLEGELVIDSMEFNPRLSMSGSEEFQELANSLEEELKRALFDVQTLNYGAADIFVKVVGFSRGSVVVKFRVGWEFKEGIRKAPDPVDKDAVRQRLERQLNLNGGTLGTYHVPMGSIRARRLLDACQFNNGECSHDCAFDYHNKMAFVCMCPTGLHLDASGKNCTDSLPVETESTPTHSHEPSPEPVPEAAPEPSPEPVPGAAPEPEPEPITESAEPTRTSTASTTMLNSYDTNHQMGPIPEHTTLQSQQSRHPDYVTAQPSPSGPQEHLGQYDNSVGEQVPASTEMALSKPESVSVHEAHEIALDHGSSQTSLPQGENKTHALHIAEGNSTEISEDPHKYFAEVPATVQVIYDDTTHAEHAEHSPVDDHKLNHDGLESTSSPHFHTETQTLTVSVIDRNHSQTTHIPYKMAPHEYFMTDFPVEMIARHELNDSIVMVSTQSPESLTPHESEHDRSNSETSASLPDVFMPSEETHTGVDTIVTTNSPLTSHPMEHHTAVNVETLAKHSENEAEPTDYPFDMEKKRDFAHNFGGNGSEEVNSSTGEKSRIAESLENSAEGRVFTSHGVKMEKEIETNSSKFQEQEIPTVIPVRIIHANDPSHSDMVMTGHANMLTPSGDNVTEIVPGSYDEMAALSPITPEEHKHDGVFSNDVYFPDSEHAENDTFLNALSPEDYDNHPLRPVTVVSRPTENATSVTNLKLKKGPRLDDDQMFQMNPNEEHEHNVTNEPTVENISAIVHVSESVPLSPVTPVTELYHEEAHMSDSERFPLPSDDNSHPNLISAGEVHEHGNVTFEAVQHNSETANKSEDASVAVDALGAYENGTEPAARDAMLKSEVLKGTDGHVTEDDILAVSVTESMSEDAATVPAITTENFVSSGTEVPVMKPEEVSTDSTLKDVEMVTMLEPELVTAPDSNFTSSVLVHDSNNSSERNVSWPSRENVIEDGNVLHPGLFNTTTEDEVDHPLTVAPLKEHLENETISHRNLHEDREAHETVAESEQSVELTTRVESVDAAAESVLNDAENSTASPSDSLITQSVVQMLTAKILESLSSESSSEANYVTTVIPHEENDISSGGEVNDKGKETDISMSAIPENKQLDAIQPENEVLVPTAQNITQNGEMKLSPMSNDTETTTDSTDMTDKGDVVSNAESPSLLVSSGEDATPSTSPEESNMNKTEGTTTTTTTTETPLESDNEADDSDLFLGKPEGERINTVKPLPHNISSTRSEYKSSTEFSSLGITNSTDENSHGDLVTGVSDHSNTAFEKPHAFTDIENRLLVESGKVPDMSTSSTTEYANEIHALPPSGGGNIIPPTAQSVVLIDPITGEIQAPTSVGQLKNETFSAVVTGSDSAIEHVQHSENATAPKAEKDLSVVSISRQEQKKKDFLNGSVNKKTLKPTGEISSLQGDSEQLITDKSVINLYEKKTVDKLQKFDKDNSKKIDKMGFAALPVSVMESDLTEDMDVTTATKEMSALATSSSTTAMPIPGTKSTTEASGSVENEPRPVDEEDENEDPLILLRGDVEHVNIVEPNDMAKKEQKSDPQRNKASRYEGKTVMNENVTVADDEHIVARSDTASKTEDAPESAIAVGIEPAVSLAANETSILADDLLTPRIQHESDTVVPLRSKNESSSSSTASSEEKVMVVTLPTDESSLNSDNQDPSPKVLGGNVEDNTTVVDIPLLTSMNSESSSEILNAAGNSTVTNVNHGNVGTPLEEGSDSEAPTTAPSLEPSINTTIETSSNSEEVPAITVVTLNSEDLAKLHKGTTVTLEDGESQNSTRNFNTTEVIEDASPAGHNNGVIHQLTAENGTAVGGYVFGEVPMAFSKCASGQFQCVNGTSHEGAYCVSQVAKCDSVNDCSDASDEMGCVEEGCPGNFQCSSGQCLKRHLVCNGIVDCNDGSDEVNCEKWHCQFDEFQCSSGRCIPFLWHCDGKPDCDNHTDEYNCMSSCGNDEYLCPERWCIPMTWRCNGIAECANGEDEKLCDCSLDQFRCNTGGCIPKMQVCDSVEHCPDMSDEWGCVRLHNDTMNLQIRSAEGTWHPVCGDGWDSSWSDLACQSLGYSKAIFTENPPVSDSVSEYYALKPGNAVPLRGASSQLTSSLQKSGNESSCTSGTVVEVSCQEFTCGSHGLADGVAARLVGGDGATNGQWPSVALLYHTRHKSSCTASIISPKWLLSSYSCLHLRDKMLTADSWVAFGGGSMFETDKPETQIREVQSIIPYPQVKYNQFLYNNDIALIELSQPLMFTRYVGAICLPEKEIEPRQLCVTAGWGYTSPGEINFSQYLHYLPVPTIDLRDCNSTKHYAGFITQDEICAGFTDAEKSPCYNDEGAPLMCVSEGGVWELQGVLSYHSNCGQGYHPSIFSSITAVRGWVEKTVGSRFERKSTFNVRRRRALAEILN